MNGAEIHPNHRRPAPENGSRQVRYDAFARALHVREIRVPSYACDIALFRRLDRAELDHLHVWRQKGGGRVRIVTAEPYDGGAGKRRGLAEAYRDRLIGLGFEAMILPDVHLHHPTATVVLGLYGLPGYLDDLVQILRNGVGFGTAKAEARHAA